jgi:hypothetical protein
MNWENIVLEVTHDYGNDGGNSRYRWIARLRDGLCDYEPVPLSIGYPKADPGGGFPIAILDFLGGIGFEPYHIETHNFMGETSLGEVAEPYIRIFWLKRPVGESNPDIASDDSPFTRVDTTNVRAELNRLAVEFYGTAPDFIGSQPDPSRGDTSFHVGITVAGETISHASGPSYDVAYDNAAAEAVTRLQGLIGDLVQGQQSQET